MRLSLKAKLAALISLLVLVVVVATSALYCSALVGHALSNVSTWANQINKTVFEQSKVTLDAIQVPAGTDFNNRD